MNTDNKQSVFIPIPAKPESVFIRVACDLSTGQAFVMRLFTAIEAAAKRGARPARAVY